MAHISEDRVLETSTTTGTGAFTLAGAVTGYRTFASQMATSDTCWYAIWGVDSNGSPTGEWEGGLGTYSGVNTLTRTTVLESSNAGSAVTFSAGTKYVAITLLAGKTGQFDNVGAMLLPKASAEPPTPATGNYLYAKEIVPGNTVVKTKRPSGVDAPLQDGVAFNRLVKYQGGGATLIALSGGALTSSVTATAVAPTAGDIRTSVARTAFPTAATANSIAALYANANTLNNFVLRGSVEGEGGFRVVMRFNIPTVAAGASRFFAGLRDVLTVPTNVNPLTSTTPGAVGLAFNLATANTWYIVNNVSGTAPTNTAIGGGAPSTTELIELVLFCRPYTTTAGDITYRVRRFNGVGTPAFEATGTLSTNIPASTTLLYPSLWMVNVTATAVNFNLNQISIESDF